MNKIKFSHNYPKLWNQETAYLIKVRVIVSESLNKDLIEYDTKTSDGKYYELPKGRLIQLFFIGNVSIPFCTIRRYTPEKLLYYLDLVNTTFKIDSPVNAKEKVE